MPQPSALGVCSIVVLSFLRFGVAFVPPAQNQALQLKVPAAVHNVIQRDDSSTITTLLQGTSSSASSSSSSGSTSTSTSSTSNTSTSISTSSHDAKESFLRNLERKRAGEAIPSALLDADLARLWSSTTTPSTATTAVDDLESWKGKWRICHAPHIDTLGGLMLTKFPSVEYNFQSSDGRMVSHSRYESKVFGSGWFNADGRVVSLKQQQEIKPRADDSSVVRRKDEEVVKVIFERFWWDRNGEDRPTEAPPTPAGSEVESSLREGGAASSRGADGVDRFVQVAGQSMFFDGLSVFPVRYLDDDLCVFEFKAAGTVVASQRIK